jgi:hypothetical protein
MVNIVSWAAFNGFTTPYTCASRGHHFKVVERLNMATLMAKVKHLS